MYYAHRSRGGYRVDEFADTTMPYDSDLVVFSPTHPNSERWYNTSEAQFVWNKGVSDAGSTTYLYAFDAVPDTVPTLAHSTQSNSVHVPIPGDGIFYFHLQRVAGGSVVHYPIRVDKTPPTVSSIKLSANDVHAGDVVRVFFDAQDTASGVEKNYYVNMGGHLFLPTRSQLYIPFFESGSKKIILRVYDNAGNYVETARTIRVAPAQ